MQNSGKPLDETHPHLKEFRRFLAEFKDESDRGATLISMAMIDGLLAKCLSSFLIDHRDVKSLLDGFNAPLGTLSARVLAAFSVGLLSEREYKIMFRFDIEPTA